MKLIPNWREVLKYALSIRLMLLAGLLSGLEFVLPYLGEVLPIPAGWFNALSGLTIMAAFVTRLLAQTKLTPEPKKYEDEY